MNKKVIDINEYARKDHFNYFSSLEYPHVGVTVEVDVKELVSFCKKNNYSFYLTFIHVVALAANGVKELRQRIVDGKIVEFDECGTSHTESLNDGRYCYCTLYHNKPLAEYIKEATIKQEECKKIDTIKEDDDVLGLYFVSCLPWLHYSSLAQPTDGKNDSNPRITWGKYEEDYKGRLMMPVTLLCHHALVDGVNMAQFYENLNNEIKKMVKE